MHFRAAFCPTRTKNWTSLSVAIALNRTMLLRFAFENFRSFRDPTELSFISTARKDAPEWRAQSTHAPHGVLPVVGVWGANASGKSNLLEALLHLRWHVQNSWSQQRPHEAVLRAPWQLRMGPDAPSTRMELDLLIAPDVRVSFGYRLSELGFVEEWLYRWERSRRQVLYHRDRNQAEPWYFGPALKGQRSQIAKATRDNSLFLSAAAQHNHPGLLPIYEAIVAGIVPGRAIELKGYPLFAPDDPILDPEFRPVLLRLLASADLGITDVHPEVVKLDDPLPTNAGQIFQPAFLETLLQQRSAAPKPIRLRLRHGSAGAGWDLPPESESRGTNILLARLADLLHVLRDGRLLVLDEIDTSLHPDLCSELVRLFTDERSNPKGAQLLFSTHDRDLLGQLRADEVVLVDKDCDGVSSVTVASDYRELRSRDDLRRAHEQARLRGLPVLGDLLSDMARGAHGAT